MNRDKPAMRKFGVAARRSVAERAAADASIERAVMALPEVEGADVVCCYVSLGDEVGTAGVIDALFASAKRLCVPVVGDDGVMAMALIHERQELVVGRWGISVPAKIQMHDGPIDVALCPGVLFTRDGRRLGRGGGHYDRFLGAHPETLAVGLGYEAQLVADLPTEPHDRAMDVIVTEAGVYRAG
jgi:5-formyltetrahydrofolate cyclo-ligase